MKIIYNDLSSTGTLTASSEATGYPKENVYHPFRTREWRSLYVNSQWLEWDFGTPTTVDSVAIMNHNFPAGSTVKFQGNAASSWASPSVNETLTYSAGTMAKYFTGGAYRFWRIYVEVVEPTWKYDGSVLLDGSELLSPSTDVFYISIGRLMFGAAWSPAQTFAYGWTDGKVDPSVIVQSIEGQFYGDIRDQFETIGLSINLAESADKATLRTLFSTVGIFKNIVITLDETDVLNTTYYGRLTEAPRLVNSEMDRVSYALQFAEAV